MKEVTVLVAAPMKQAQGQTMPVKGTGVHIPKKQTSFLKKKKKIRDTWTASLFLLATPLLESLSC